MHMQTIVHAAAGHHFAVLLARGICLLAEWQASLCQHGGGWQPAI
jgi:hypothetical protein